MNSHNLTENQFSLELNKIFAIEEKKQFQFKNEKKNKKKIGRN